MSATNRGAERMAQDFYATPAWCVHRLLEAMPGPSGNCWFEPCAGDGAIVRAVNDDTIEWSACELREEEQPRLRSLVGDLCIGNYLAKPFGRHDFIITNPPYSLAQEFLQKALEEADVVAFLLRLNYLGSQKRSRFLREHTPAVFVLPNRPSFTGGGTDATEYAWFVWGVEPRVTVLNTTPRSERRP